MFIQKETQALSSRRRVGTCRHIGSSRRALRISIFRAVGLKRERVAQLKTFRSCCLDDTESRRDWWEGTLRKLDEIYGTAPSPAERHDRELLERRIRKLIPRPSGMVPLKRDVKAALKTAREMEVSVERAIAARKQTTSACWSMLGLYPGANYHEIKKG